MKKFKVMTIIFVIILIVGVIIFYNYQSKSIDKNLKLTDNNESELNVNIDNQNSDGNNKVSDKNDTKNNRPIKIENINSKIMLTKKTTFMKTSIGNSYIKLEIPETTNVQVSYIIDDCNIDSGYAFIILSKNATSTYGAEFWNSMYFWKQNEIKHDLSYDSSIYTEMKPGTYDLLILSDFGRWGITIETNLDGEEYEYEVPINENILFKVVEYTQEYNDRSPFVKEIRFKDIYFNIKSTGMLFRFDYIYADMDGYGIESIEVECELYDPNGESVGGSGSGSREIYKNNNNTATSFSWDRIYAEKGKWTGSGNCTIKTWGTPNTDSFDIHMFEFIIYF